MLAFAPSALAAALLVQGAAAGANHRTGPRGAMAGSDARARAERTVSGPCREAVLDELSAGRRLTEACAAQRRRAGHAALVHGLVFGYVATREVDLRAVRLVVGRAVLCRRWPLREPSGSVLRVPDMQQAGCRPRRMRQPVPVAVVRTDGTRRDAVMFLQPDSDSRIELSYSALDLELHAAGLGTLDDFARVEIGQGAWAGSVDLAQLRVFRASWHLRWVRSGLGSPGLFAVAHPDHQGAALAQALEAHAQRVREDAAFRAVMAGRVSGQEFLDRFPDSPLRPRVEAMLGVTPAERSVPDEPSE